MCRSWNLIFLHIDENSRIIAKEKSIKKISLGNMSNANCKPRFVEDIIKISYTITHVRKIKYINKTYQ